MVQIADMADVADNSGAAIDLHSSGGRRCGIGGLDWRRDYRAVKEATPDSQVKKGKVVRAVVVRTRKSTGAGMAPTSV